jgi:5,10-methenyltetrahydrofolate synthetase
MSEALDGWDEIRAWRKATRQRLVAAREAVEPPVRDVVEGHLGEILDLVVDHARARGTTARIAFYWPIKGEISVFGAIQRAIARGAIAALPFIPGPNVALQFRRWAPGTRVVRGIWNIPTPEREDPVVPDAMVVPVVGFDAACHRLGNGGGFYDRTFAALPAATVRIGIGFECLRLPTIHPQPHDVPMHVVVTETAPDLEGFVACSGLQPANPPSSPPCGLGEVDERTRGF